MGEKEKLGCCECGEFYYHYGVDSTPNLCIDCCKAMGICDTCTDHGCEVKYG